MQLLPLSLLLLCWPSAVVLAQSPAASTSSHGSSSSSSSLGSTSSTSLPSGSTSASATPTSSAQLPSLSQYSPCLSNCLDLSISQVGCNSIADVDCFCGNATRFVTDITSCVSSQCPGDLAAAENVSQQFCNAANPSVSLSFSPLPSTLSSTTSSSSSASAPTNASSIPSSSSASSSSSSPSTSPSGGSNQSSAAADALSRDSRLRNILGLGLCLSLVGLFL